MASEPTIKRVLLDAGIIKSDEHWETCEAEIFYAAPVGKRCCCIICHETAKSHAEVYMTEPEMQIVYVCLGCIARAEGREAPVYAKGGQVVMEL